MPRRKPPKSKIIEYKQLKTAAGGSGSGGGCGWDFGPGESLRARVIADEPGGYAIVIVQHNLEGFLPTQALLRTGEEILCQFVCVHKHRILVSARFSNNVSKVSDEQPVRWEEHLDGTDIQAVAEPEDDAPG